MATDIHLRVHTTGTAEHLSARLEQCATVHMALRFGTELPIESAAEHQLQKAQRDAHERIAAALRAGFEQQHRMAAALRQAIGHDTSGRAAADHHIIELFRCHAE